MEKNQTIIKETIEELLRVMNFSAQVEIVKDGSDSIVANIISPEGGFLIGPRGVTLFALQHIVRLILAKKLQENSQNFIVDVNDYRKDRAKIIKELALEKAEQAVREQKKIIFQPMSSYERRVVHLVLAENKNIICESEGEGEERHIVIRPAA